MQLDESADSDLKQEAKLSMGEFPDRKLPVPLELEGLEDQTGKPRHPESVLIRTLKQKDTTTDLENAQEQDRKASESEGESSTEIETSTNSTTNKETEANKLSCWNTCKQRVGVLWQYTRDFYQTNSWKEKEIYLKLTHPHRDRSLAMCLFGLCCQYFLWEIMVWFDSSYQPKLTWVRITYTFSILMLLSEISFMLTANRRAHSRTAFLFVVTLRVLVRVVETSLIDVEDYSHLVRYSVFNLMLESVLATSLIASTGQFFLLECIAVNTFLLVLLGIMVSLYWPADPAPLSGFLVMIFYLPWSCFNAMDSKKISDDNLEVYKNLAELDQQNSQLSSFLSRLLPKHTTQALLRSRQSSEVLNSVTLLYADIVGFTEYSAGRSPRQVIELLSKLFTEFDKECNRLGLYKLYTIGDCYVVSSIVDRRNRKTPTEEASDVVNLGLRMIDIIVKVRKLVGFEKLDMRIGVHTGNAYGGVIGTEIVRYDLYGKDVVIANKMESGGLPGKVCVSEQTRSLLIESSNYVFSEHESIYIKTLGASLKSFFVKRAGLS